MLIEQVIIRPTAVILGDNVYIGKGTIISDHVVIYDNVYIGENCFIGAGSVIGGMNDEYDAIKDIDSDEVYYTVDIGNKCSIGANTVIERGYTEYTAIGEEVQIGANCVIGHDACICVDSVVHSGAVVVPYVTLDSSCELGYGSVLTANWNTMGLKLGGIPAIPVRMEELSEYEETEGDASYQGGLLDSEAQGYDDTAVEGETSDEYNQEVGFIRKVISFFRKRIW